jgi:hypothetical protein
LNPDKTVPRLYKRAFDLAKFASEFQDQGEKPEGEVCHFVEQLLVHFPHPDLFGNPGGVMKGMAPDVPQGALLVMDAVDCRDNFHELVQG